MAAKNAGPERKGVHVGELMGAWSVLITSCSSWASAPQAPPQGFLQLYQNGTFFHSQPIAQFSFILGHFLAWNATLTASSIKTNKDLCPGSKWKHLFWDMKIKRVENNAYKLDSGFRQALGLSLQYFSAVWPSTSCLSLWASIFLSGGRAKKCLPHGIIVRDK